MEDGKAGTLIERAMRELIAIPAIAAQLIQESKRDDVSPHRVEKLLMTDPALAARILRVVNSPYYGLPKQVKNLGQAVIILGLRQIQNLAIGIMAYSAINTRDPRVAHEGQEIWAHSLETAIASQLVAEGMVLELAYCEEAFLIGLMHEVGRMFFLSQFTGPYLTIVGSGDSDDPDILRAAFGVDQFEAAHLLLTHWGMPATLAEAMQELAEPNHPSPPVRAVLAAQAILSDLDLVLPKAASDVGLAEEDVKDIRETVIRSSEQVRQMYGQGAA